MSFLPSVLREVYIPVKGENELSRVQGSYISVPSKPEGDILVTTMRISFLARPVGVIRVQAEDFPLQETLVNIGFNSFISANVRVEKKLFLEERILEVNYEAPGGLARKALFKVKDKGQIEETLRNIELAVSRFRLENTASNALPLPVFAKFAEFLGVNKAIRPLYYDGVTRCIAIPSSYFCIRDSDWTVDGSPDMIEKAKSWISEFRGRIGG